MMITMMMISSCSLAPLVQCPSAFPSRVRMWDFSRAIAVNGNSIPTCPVRAQVIDPHELCWGIEHIDAGFFLTVDLVHF